MHGSVGQGVSQDGGKNTGSSTIYATIYATKFDMTCPWLLVISGGPTKDVLFPPCLLVQPRS
jgi:hypothetical protein